VKPSFRVRMENVDMVDILKNIKDLVKLLESLSKDKDILIITHRRADLDAYISTYILRRILKSYLGFNKINCLIPNGFSTRITHIADILKLDFSAKPSSISLDKEYLLFALDIGGEAVVKEVMDIISDIDIETKILIDHHIHKDIFLRNFTHLFLDNTKYSSTIEILLDLGLSLDESFLDKISYDEASVIIASILVETRFILHAKPKAINYIYQLSSRYPESISNAFNLLHIETDRSERIALLKGLQRITLYEADGYLIVLSRLSAYQSTLASKLLTLGADIAVVYGEENGVLRVSVRLSNRALDKLKLNAVSNIVNPLIERLGGDGGGHPGAAMYMVKDVDIELSETIISILTDYLKKQGLFIKNL